MPAASTSRPACSTRRGVFLTNAWPAPIATMVPTDHQAPVRPARIADQPMITCSSSGPMMNAPEHAPKNRKMVIVPVVNSRLRNRLVSMNGSRPLRCRNRAYSAKTPSITTEEAIIRRSTVGQPFSRPWMIG